MAPSSVKYDIYHEANNFIKTEINAWFKNSKFWVFIVIVVGKLMILRGPTVE